MDLQVLCKIVERKSLGAAQAVKIVKDIFFNSSNRIYKLGLSPAALRTSRQLVPSTDVMKIAKVDVFVKFLNHNPSVKFLRLQWLDYTATLRARIIPITLALGMFKNQKSIGITKAALGLLQHDKMVPPFNPVGEYELIPCFEGLHIGGRGGYATVQGEFREKDGNEVLVCPRSALRRIVEIARKQNISFLVGFEIEVTLITAAGHPPSHAHSWSNASALRNHKIMAIIEEIVTVLERSKIEIQQFHPDYAYTHGVSLDNDITQRRPEIPSVFVEAASRRSSNKGESVASNEANLGDA